MPSRSNIIYLSRFGFTAAFMYCIPVIFFLTRRRFTDTWLIYLGSALFLLCVFIFGILYTGKKTTPTKTYNGFLVTILGVIFSCVLILLLTLIIAPDVYGIGSANDALTAAPPAMSQSGTHGILFVMLSDALIINFCAGIFSAVMTKSKSEEKNLPANQPK